MFGGLARCAHRLAAFDDAAAETDLAFVHDDRLSGRHGPLRFGELDGAVLGVDAGERAGRVLLTVTRLRGIDPVAVRRFSTDPVEVGRGEPFGEKRGMLVALHDDQTVAREVLARDVPRVPIPFAPPADTAKCSANSS